MFRLSQTSDIEELRNIGEICFGDDKEFQDLFYAVKYKADDCFVCEEDGKVVASAFAFTLKLKTKNAEYKAAYLYAIATHPDYRNKGISTGLLDFAWNELKNRGYKIAVLVPATEELFAFYEKAGFKNLTNIAVAEVAGVVCRSCSARSMLFEPASSTDYYELREKLLENTPHFVWSAEDLRYQDSFSAMIGNGGLFILDGGNGVAVMEPCSKGSVLKEIIIEPEKLGEAAEAFSNPRMRGAMTFIRTTQEIGETVGIEIKPFAMAKWTDDVPEEELKGVYFGLALD